MADEQTRRELLKWWIESYLTQVDWGSDPAIKATGDGQWRPLPATGPHPKLQQRITLDCEPAYIDSPTEAGFNEARRQSAEWERASKWCKEFPFLVGMGLLRMRSRVLLGLVHAGPANLCCVVDWSGPKADLGDDLHDALLRKHLWPDAWDRPGISMTAEEDWHVRHSLITYGCPDDSDWILADLVNASNIDEAVDILQAACKDGPPFTIDPPEILYADKEGKMLGGFDIDDLRTDIAANEIVYPYGSKVQEIKTAEQRDSPRMESTDELSTRQTGPQEQRNVLRLIVDWDTFVVKRQTAAGMKTTTVDNEEQRKIFKALVNSSGTLSSQAAAVILPDANDRNNAKKRLKAKLQEVQLSMQNGNGS